MAKADPTRSSSKGKAGAPREAPSLSDLEFMADPDAIEQRPLGGVTRGVLIGLSLLLFFGLGWAYLSEMDEIVTAPGRLISSSPNLQVQSFESSLIQTIDVKPGQIVKAGQQLAALDPTFTGADQAILQGSIAKLEARERRVMSELKGQKLPGEASSPGKEDRLQGELRDAREANYRSRVKAQDENIARLEAALKSNRDDEKNLGERLKSVREVEQMQQRLLDQNFGARKQLLEARDRRQEVERELERVGNREKELLREIASQRAEQQAFQNDWRQRAIEELAEIRRERDGIAEQLQKADKRRSLVLLKAPVDAIVLEVPKGSIGSVVRDAEVLFTLVPMNVPLMAELQVASADVGFIKVGDPVRVKLDAFPFQKFGTLKGKVHVVSEDAFSRDPSGLQGSKSLSANYYLARVELESTKLERRADEVSLRPGLTLSGEVKIGRRTVLSYFLYPIIGTLDESLRERR